MKNAAAYNKKFTTLLRKVKAAHKPGEVDALDPVARMIMSFLEWNATTRLASRAYDQIWAVMIDINDMRVTHPHEMALIIGGDYPQADERVSRLREVLQAIYNRERQVTLDHLAKKGKKDARTYLESLPGMTPYVAAQVLLLCFDGHAMPVDDVMAEALRDAEAVAPDASVAEIATFLERQIKAGQGVEVHMSLKAWSQVNARALASHKKKVAAKKAKAVTKKVLPTKALTTKKVTTKKTTTKKTKTTTKKVTTKKAVTKKKPVRRK